MHDRIPRRIVVIVEIQLNRLDRKQNWDCGLRCPCTQRYGFRIITTTTSVVNFIILENKEYRKARLVGHRKPPWCVHIVVSMLGQITVAVLTILNQNYLVYLRVRVIDGLCLHHFPIWTAILCVLNSLSWRIFFCRLSQGVQISRSWIFRKGIRILKAFKKKIFFVV